MWRREPLHPSSFPCTHDGRGSAQVYKCIDEKARLLHLLSCAARVGHRVRRRRPQGREESSDDYADADIGDGPQAPDISGQGKGRVGYADHDDALVIDGLTLAPKAGGVDDEHVGYGRGRGRDCRRDPQGGKPLPKSDAEDDQQVRGAEHADRDGACEAGVAPSASGNAGTEHYLGGDAGKGDGDGGRDVGGGRKHRGAKRPRARLARSQQHEGVDGLPIADRCDAPHVDDRHALAVACSQRHPTAREERERMRDWLPDNRDQTG